MVYDLAKSRQQSARNRTMSVDGVSSSLEVQVLRDELSTLYKQKNKNDQDLIEANRKLADSEGRLGRVTEERDKLKADNARLCARIAELEHTLKRTNDDKTALYDEWLTLNALVKSKTDKLTQMETEQMQLINKVCELNEKKANCMNAEVDDQTRRQQEKIKNAIAEVIAADPSRDDKLNSLLLNSNAPVGDFMAGDMVPQCSQSKFEANEGEILYAKWLSSEQFATAGSDKKVRIWRVETNGKQSKLYDLTSCNQAITRLDLETETRRLLGSCNDQTVRVWNMDTQRLLTTFAGHSDKVTVARFHQTGQVVSGSCDRSIKVWDLRSQRLWDGRTSDAVQIIEMAGKITSFDMAADGQSFLCSTRDDTLSLIDLRTQRTIQIYSSEQYRTSSDYSRCIISPGMKYVSAGSSDGNVFVWNLRTTKLEMCLARGHEHPVLSVNWNPSGRGLLSADKQKIVVLWS